VRERKEEEEHLAHEEEEHLACKEEERRVREVAWRAAVGERCQRAHEEEAHRAKGKVSTIPFLLSSS